MALRREQFDIEFGSERRWSQARLAEETGISRSTIKRIETGNGTKSIHPEDILSLCDAFKLTTRERNEFIMAANFIEDAKIVKHHQDNEALLNTLIKQLSGTEMPIFINDIYGDIVAANAPAMAFYNVPMDMVATGLGEGLSRFNMFRFVFDQQSGYRGLFGDKWRDELRRSVYNFKADTLRYRATKYWQDLFNDLSTIDNFWEVWRSPYLDEDFFSNTQFFSVSHAILGDIAYFSSASVTYTSAGKLNCVVYIPNDGETLEKFSNLAKQVGTAVYKVSKWPKDNELISPEN